MTSENCTFCARAVALAAVIALPLTLLTMPAPAFAEDAMDLPANFEANVMVVSGSPGGPRSSMLEIRIREWTTQEEREQILTEIKEASAGNQRNRNRAVARALRGGSTVGSMNLRARTGWPIRYSRYGKTADGKQRILLATDRPVSFAEAFGGSMAGDFDVTVIELSLDAEGKGEGVMSVGTEVLWNNDTQKLEVTNVSSQPVRLGDVRRVK